MRNVINDPKSQLSIDRSVVDAFRDCVECRLVFLYHVQIIAQRTLREESYKFHKESIRIRVLLGRLHRRQ